MTEVSASAIDPRAWSDWLTYERIAAIYGTTVGNARKLKGKGGIRWSVTPGLGIRLYRPDIDRYIERCVPELARKLHEIEVKTKGGA